MLCENPGCLALLPIEGEPLIPQRDGGSLQTRPRGSLGAALALEKLRKT